jgi:hypothetical protein
MALVRLDMDPPGIGLSADWGVRGVRGVAGPAVDMVRGMLLLLLMHRSPMY